MTNLPDGETGRVMQLPVDDGQKGFEMAMVRQHKKNTDKLNELRKKPTKINWITKAYDQQ